MKNPYAQAPTSEVNYSRYPLAPASTSQPPAYQSDADADDSYVENLYDEGDRIASERTPQVEDSPSCYSDPYEYQSTVGGLGRQGTQRSQRPGSRYLHRNGTLLPGDSISEYNVPAPTSRRSHDPMPEQDRRADYLYGNAAPPAAGPSSDGHGHYDDYYQYQQPYDGSGVAAQDYAYDDGAGYKSTYGTAMYAEAPYDSAAAPYSSSKHAHSQSHATTNADFDMVYSTGQGNAYDYDDDDDYYRAKSQQEHAAAYPPQPPPPGLFANDLAQANGLAPKSHFSMFAPGDAAGASEGQRKNFLDHDEDDSAGAKTRRLFGVNDGSSLAEQIERRRRGIGRQRWPIVTWAFALAFASVFIAEIVKAKAVTGQAIQTKVSESEGEKQCPNLPLTLLPLSRTALLQPNDRPLSPIPHLLWRPLRPLHAQHARRAPLYTLCLSQLNQRNKHRHLPALRNLRPPQRPHLWPIIPPHQRNVPPRRRSAHPLQHDRSAYPLRTN